MSNVTLLGYHPMIITPFVHHFFISKMNSEGHEVKLILMYLVVSNNGMMGHRISEDKIEIMKENEEAKMDLVISPEPLVRCVPAIEKPNLRPKIKSSKSKLGINLASMNIIKKGGKGANRALKMLGKKGKDLLGLNKLKSTATQVKTITPPPTSIAHVYNNRS